MESMQGKITALQRQVENVVEQSIETSSAASTTQVALKLADSHL